MQQNLPVWQPDITGIEAASDFVRIMGKMPWATYYAAHHRQFGHGSMLSNGTRRDTQMQLGELGPIATQP